MSGSLSIFTNRWFVVPSLLGGISMALVEELTEVSVQVAVLGAILSILCGLALSLIREIEALRSQFDLRMVNLGVSLPGQASERLSGLFQELTAAVGDIAMSEDTVFRQLAEERITEMTRRLSRMSEGRLTYIGTESWRNAYAEVLRQYAVAEYRSVSLIRSFNYWQDQPGQQSLKLNCELAASGVTITRILIVGEIDCEEAPDKLPEQLAQWATAQHEAGIHIRVVRESDLRLEKDLLVDIGIYGDRAVGVLETDQSSQTVRFRLSFHCSDVQHYHSIWSRLLLYAREWEPESSKSQSQLSAN